MDKKTYWRYSIYSAGTIIAALALTLISMGGLGVSPIIAIPYSIATGIGADFSSLLLCHYLLLVGIQFLMKGRKFRKLDLLQVPISFVLSGLTGGFEWLLKDLLPETFWQKLLCTLAGLTLLGIGSTLIVRMRLIPNPVDGLMGTVSDVTGKKLGTAKNLLDVVCMCIALALDLLLHHRLVSIGLGTVIAMVMTGRVIAVFNRFFMAPLLRRSGMEGI